MDIAALSTSMAMEQLSVSVNMAVMSKVLDTAEASAEVLTQMAETLTVPGLGENIDIMA